MPPPKSATSASTSLVGTFSLLLSIGALSITQPTTSNAIVLLLLGAALPMVVWSVVIEKAYARTSTGLCFTLERPISEVLKISCVKIVGLAFTLFCGYVFYHYAWWYGDAGYRFYFDLLVSALPYLLVLAPPYVVVTSRYMVKPKDALWHFGKLVLLDSKNVSLQKVKEHLLAWMIKMFFLAFMVALLPGMVSGVLGFDFSTAMAEPARSLPAMVIFLVKFLFLFDVCFGTIGYILTFRVLDTHVVSPNPHLSAWAAALLCYPPLIVTSGSGPLNYTIGTQEWYVWFFGHDLILGIWAVAIVALVAVYVWATVIFGMRFSNLTNRGVITNGPYRYFKHPAYLSKNIFWWLAVAPFFSTLGPDQAVKNCLLLLMVNMIYLLRARTEEKHLMTDPAYRDYSDWIAKYGVLPRFISWGRRRMARSVARQPRQSGDLT